jgi:hypothetical protein
MLLPVVRGGVRLDEVEPRTMATPVGPVPRDPNDPDLWDEWDEGDDEGDTEPRFRWPVRLVALLVAIGIALLLVLAR